jgi:glyoxylate/hydroxypyruvate reductase A
MALLIGSTIGPMEPWRDALAKSFPQEEIRCWPEIGNPQEIDIVLLGPPQRGIFGPLGNLKLVVVLRAGVDDLLDDPELPPRVPLCRAQEPGGNKMIDEYALLHVLRHHRYMPDFIAAEARGEWINPGVIPAEERRVGFMGLGIIGVSAARRVRDLGFQTAAWSRTRKDEPGIESFYGAAQFDEFLARTDILVNLLAGTPETMNILNRRNFALMPGGSCIINLGRGEAIVDDDLITALNAGHLHSATLDVFRTEPLPADHPFWSHPRITVMPHTARRPRATEIIPYALENIRRFRAGEPLLQPVERERGY